MQRNSNTELDHTFREVEYTMTITRNKIKFQNNFLRKYKYIQYQQISSNFGINFFADIKVGYSTCSMAQLSDEFSPPNIGTIFRIIFFPNNKVGYIMVTISSKAFRRNFFPNIGKNFRITFFPNIKGCISVTISITTFRRIFFTNIGTNFGINFFPNINVGHIVVTMSRTT